MHPSLLHSASGGTGIDGSSSTTGFSFAGVGGFATGAAALVTGTADPYVSIPSLTVGAATSGEGFAAAFSTGLGASVEWTPAVQGGIERNSSNVRTCRSGD